MKLMFKIVSVFLCFNSVTPAMMYYIYDDSPMAGYVAGEFTKSGYDTRNKYGLNSQYHKPSNEHVVDSHFKVMKSSSHLINTTPVPKSSPVAQEAQKNTEEPKQWQQRNVQMENTRTYQDTISSNKMLRGKTNSSPVRITNEQSLHSKINKQEYRIQMRQRGRQDKNENYENKPNPVEVNVHKTQISTDPQKIVKLKNNRQITAISVPGPEDNYQRIPTSLVVDSKLQKARASPYNDRNSQIMSRILDDMTQKITDRRNQKGEYRKRDTDGIQAEDFVEKSKRNNISDNMKKYIGKEKSVLKDRRGALDMARIGSLERSVEARDTPYALFYRMNPESLDQQDGFYLMNSMEETSKNIYSPKEKRFPITFDSELDLKLSKINSNTVKLHKKIPHYIEYQPHRESSQGHRHIFVLRN